MHAEQEKDYELDVDDDDDDPGNPEDELKDLYDVTIACFQSWIMLQQDAQLSLDELRAQYQNRQTEEDDVHTTEGTAEALPPPPAQPQLHLSQPLDQASAMALAAYWYLTYI